MSDVNWRLAMRSLKRDLRAADVRALFIALVLAVAASTMIAFFLDRLERGLERQAGQMLGGDLVLEQRDPFSTELRERLENAGFVLSDQVDLVSMISRDGRFQPASLKAVEMAPSKLLLVRRQGRRGLILASWSWSKSSWVTEYRWDKPSWP